MVQKKFLFRICIFILSCAATLSCRQEEYYYRNTNSIRAPQNQAPNYRNNYYPYRAPNSRAYRNPYEQPSGSRYQYYDYDQYYVPPTNHYNQEPDHRFDPNMKL